MIQIEQCTNMDSEQIEVLFNELIYEIIEETTGDPALFQISDTKEIFKQGLHQGMLSVFKAVNENHQIIGFISLCESYSLYADGKFGIIQELYVLNEYRSQNIGKELLNIAIKFGQEKEWKRLEVCTPSIPEFERTLSFYQNNGFEITGGKKLKILINLGVIHRRT